MEGMEGMEGMEAVAHNPPALKQQRDRARKAFSLIEAAIVLGVVGLVIGGIWWAASAVRDAQKIQRLSEDIYLALSKLREVYQHQQIPSGYNEAYRLLAGLLPGAGYWGIPYPWKLDRSDPDGSAFYVTVTVGGDGGSGHPYEKYNFRFFVSYPDKKTCIELTRAMVPNDRAAQEIYLVFQRPNGEYLFQATLTSAQQAYTLAQTHCEERDLSMTGHFTGGYSNVQFRFTQQ